VLRSSGHVVPSSFNWEVVSSICFCWHVSPALRTLGTFETNVPSMCSYASATWQKIWTSEIFWKSENFLKSELFRIFQINRYSETSDMTFSEIRKPEFQNIRSFRPADPQTLRPSENSDYSENQSFGISEISDKQIVRHSDLQKVQTTQTTRISEYQKFQTSRPSENSDYQFVSRSAVQWFSEHQLFMSTGSFQRYPKFDSN